MLSTHNRYTILAPVPDEDERRLRLAFVDGVPTARRPAATFLRDLRAKHHWLACDCADESLALMSPRRLPTGDVVLVRHGRAAHADSCPFHRLKPLSELPDIDGDDLGDPDGAYTEDDSRGFLPGDGQLLTHILSYSGLTSINASDLVWQGKGPRARVGHKDVSDHYAQLDGADDLVLADGINLQDLRCAHPNGRTWLAREIAGLEWPDGVTPFGFILGSVSGINGNALTFGRGDKDGDHVVCSECVLGLGSEPAMALVRLAWHPDHLEPVSAFTHGIFNRALLLPVESDGERHVARLLLEQMRYWLDHESIDVQLHKPLTGNLRPAFEMLAGVRRRVAVVLVPPEPAVAAYEAAMMQVENLRELDIYNDVLDLPTPLPEGDALFALRKRVTAVVLP